MATENQQQQWLLPPSWQLPAGWQIGGTPSLTQTEREDEAVASEEERTPDAEEEFREGVDDGSGERQDAGERQESLKRSADDFLESETTCEEDEGREQQDGQDDRNDQDCGGRERERNKRRRVGEILYHYVPAGCEENQTIVEYATPIALPYLFQWLGFNDHAQAWCWAIVALHTLENAVTDFGPRAKGLRWKAWISPLGHLLIDTLYMQAMVTTMCLYPEWFVEEEKKPVEHVRWMAWFMVFNLMIHTCASLKMEYTRQRICQESVEPFGPSAYVLASILLLHPSKIGMWVGLILFNATPFYVAWAFEPRRKEPSTKCTT